MPPQKDTNIPFKQVQDRYSLRNEEVIMYFFQQVYDQPDSKLSLIKELDVYYFIVKPKLNTVVLKQLLFGNLDQNALS